MSAFNLSAWAVKHPAFVLYLILAAAAAGLYAYLGMGRAEDPSFTIKTMVVSANWPGATSDEVQRQVADKIEEKLQETPYLDYLRTYSLPGRAVVTVQLRNDTPPKAVPDVWYQVWKKVGDIRHTLPEGVTGPFLDDEYGDVHGCRAAKAAGRNGVGLSGRPLVRPAEPAGGAAQRPRAGRHSIRPVAVPRAECHRALSEGSGMFDRAWQVPQDQFITAWNGAKSLDEATARVKELAGGAFPRWAVLARAMELRKEGVKMKPLSAKAAEKSYGNAGLVASGCRPITNPNRGIAVGKGNNSQNKEKKKPKNGSKAAAVKASPPPKK